ncbi:MAG: MarR family winged helix-turn-helix transcriptional regulator [Bilifractor sp.]|jgi:DNA-binding MarR family transcriptional regulator
MNNPKSETDVLLEQQTELNRITKEYDECYRNLSRLYGIPEGQLWTLYEMRLRGGEMAQSDLVNATFMPKQTVNSSIKKMEALGLISLSRTGSGRRKTVTLTEAGEALARETADRVIRAEASSLRKMTEEERRDFLLLFERYISELQRSVEGEQTNSVSEENAVDERMEKSP